MRKFFNTEGPVTVDDHYLIPPLERLDLEEISLMIEQNKYFVLQAPPKSGKTSVLMALRDKLNQEGKYRALYISFKKGKDWGDDLEHAMLAIVQEISLRVEETFGSTPEKNSLLDQDSKFGFALLGLNLMLGELSAQNSTPLVVLIDDIDNLLGDPFNLVLRQIRSSFDQRPKRFPQSMILCGIGEVKDYGIHPSSGKRLDPGGAVFNIKSSILGLSNFSQKDVEKLLFQHTEETGQKFDAGVSERVWELTQGQPWFVNGLAQWLTLGLKENRDPIKTIKLERVELAKEALILKRVTPLGQLSEKLRDPMVKKVIIPILEGYEGLPDFSREEFEYVQNFGLINRERGKRPVISNPIYRELFSRELMEIRSGQKRSD